MHYVTAIQPNGERLRYERWVYKRWLSGVLFDPFLRRGLDNAVRIVSDF